MVNEKLLETKLSLDAIYIILLTQENNQEEIKRLFKYRKDDFLELVALLESKLLIKYHGGKITLREAALDLFVKDDIEVLVDGFMELFPKGVKNLAGHYVRSNRSDVTKKLSAVIKKYKLDPEVILKVTKAYVTSWEAQDWKYCKCSGYYISKDNTSLLVDDCMNYTKEEPVEILNQFKMKKL